MTEFTAKVLRSGQITLPEEIRDTTGVEMGDYVVLVLKEVIKKGKKK